MCFVFSSCFIVDVVVVGRTVAELRRGEHCGPTVQIADTIYNPLELLSISALDRPRLRVFDSFILNIHLLIL